MYLDEGDLSQWDDAGEEHKRTCYCPNFLLFPVVSGNLVLESFSIFQCWLWKWTKEFSLLGIHWFSAQSVEQQLVTSCLLTAVP